MRQEDKRQRPKREFNIVTSGQFRTLAMFSLNCSAYKECQYFHVVIYKRIVLTYIGKVADMTDANLSFCASCSESKVAQFFQQGQSWSKMGLYLVNKNFKLTKNSSISVEKLPDLDCQLFQIYYASYSG